MLHKCLYTFLLVLILPVLVSAQEAYKSYGIIPSADTATIHRLLRDSKALKLIDADSCLLLAQEALHLSEQSMYAYGIAKAALLIASKYSIAVVPDSAIIYLNKALQYVDKVNNEVKTNLQMDIYMALGTPYYQKGDYEKAAYYFYNALRAIISNNITTPYMIADAFSNLALLWLDLNRFDYAEEYLKKSEAIGLLTKDSLTLMMYYVHISDIYGVKEEWEKVFQSNAKAEKIAAGKNIISVRQVALANMGLARQFQERYKEAIFYYNQSIELAPNKNSFSNNIVGYNSLGYAYYKMGNYAKAREMLLRAVELSDKYNNYTNAQTTAGVLALVYNKEHKYKEGLQMALVYMRMIDSTMKTKMSEGATKMEVAYRNAEKDNRIKANELLLSKKEIELKNKNILIGSIAACVLLMASILWGRYLVNKNKQRLQQQQIHNLEQQHALMHQEQEINHLKDILTGEERERARLARELHDGIGGMLAAVNMNLNAEKNSKESVNTLHLNKAIDLLQETTSEVRRTAHNLMPDVLIRNGLEQALQIYCENISTGEDKVEIDLHFRGTLTLLDRSAELLVYRIVQELLQNIIKHAQASHAELQIIENDSKLIIIVEDNGVGFDTNEIKHGYGLQSLQFRVKALQGYVSITSQKGQSTTVYIEFDLQQLKNISIA